MFPEISLKATSKIRHKRFLRLFQRTSKTKHKGSPRFFQTTSKIIQGTSEILQSASKIKQDVFPRFFQTTSKTKQTVSRDSFEILQEPDTNAPRNYFNYFKTKTK